MASEDPSAKQARRRNFSRAHDHSPNSTIHGASQRHSSSGQNHSQQNRHSFRRSSFSKPAESSLLTQQQAFHDISSSVFLPLGRVSLLKSDLGYGFLTPIISDDCNTTITTHQASKLQTPDPLQADQANILSNHEEPIPHVYFKLPPTNPDAHSSCSSGLLKLQLYDTLEYISDFRGSTKPRAIHTRLVACSARSTNDMASYLRCLVSHCLEDGHTNAVLRELIKAPAGLLTILEHPNPNPLLIILILKLVNAICDQDKMFSLSTSKMKDFCRLLIRTPFFMLENDALSKLLTRLPSLPYIAIKDEIQSEWGKPLHTLILSTKTSVLRMLRELPDELPFLVCLIQILDKMCMEVVPNSTESKSITNHTSSFAMQVIFTIVHASGVEICNKNVSYDKLSLLPLTSEIKPSLNQSIKRPSVSLPVAKSKGGYDSTTDYIDTYFRLLREDTFASLKKGISDFSNGKLDYRDMTVWFGVSTAGVHFQNSLPGLVVGLQLKDGQANRPHPKLPLVGSLLCICDSGGSFQNPIWASVARCEQLKKTTVMFVEVLEGSPAAATQHFGSSSPWGRIIQASGMVVAESPAYYRAYEPVLKALQRLDPETMPFQDELVSAKSSKKAPSYLNDLTILDWSCLNAQESYGKLQAGVRELIQPTLCGFQTCLDPSQVGAVNHILQNQLAMIQGPPGTGKTFLSVRIVELLLSASTRSKKPMLIVTYKNQALDHFLESCLRFCEPKDIVRVGGRSTGEKLACCNLQHLLRTAERSSSSDYIANCEKLKQLQTEVRIALSKLYRCQTCNMETLRSQFSLHKLLLTRDHMLSHEPPSNASPDDKNLADDIQKKHHNLLKQWVPEKVMFDAIRARLSSEPTSTRPTCEPWNGKSATNNDQEEPDDSTEDNEEGKDFENLLQDLNSGNHPKSKEDMDWQSSNYLKLANVDLHDALFRSNSIGNFDPTRYTWLLEADPWELSDEHRCILILVIMRQNFETCLREFLELKQEYDHVCTDNAAISKEKRIAVLKEAKIIGMTTTGAAINQDIIAAVSPSIILVEEAAEILEPHIMAMLSTNVEHLILIGDHKQLRPSVECYELQIRHNLGISMLERLAENNKLPYKTLGLQSRMREEFLQMIQPIYPSLISNIKVVNGARNKPANCMASTMYFWNHSVEETQGRSPTNEQEAHMVVALAKWLLSEGHKHEEITVICAYSGQVSTIRKMLDGIKGEREEAIDVQTIDRFQGSENRIIIASLVRSNTKGKIGYLAEQNRLCVTVSRARSGLYICGNAETLSQRSPHWKTLIECFKRQDCIGNDILLLCPRHPKNPPISLHNDKAHMFSTDVCTTPCRMPLACGHICTKTCHWGDHPLCKVKVQYQFQSCQHTRTKLCSELVTDLKCLEEVWIQLEKCNHTKKCMCWEKTQNVSSARVCDVLCGKTLACTHPCTLFCGQDCNSKPCPVCAEILKIKAQKEKEARIKQIKEKKWSIDCEIEKLKREPESGPIFKELFPEGETAPEYCMVKDRTEKFIQPTHRNLPVVKRIQKVTNAKLELKFLQAKRELTDVLAATQLLFHGTDDAGVEGITNGGFRLPSESKKNMFGVGCYFATDSSKSAQQLYTKGSNKLLLCEVLLGRAWSVKSAKPDLNLKTVRDKNYDSVFSMRNNRESGGTEFDEYIIYDPKQAMPRYVVHYENMGCSDLELQIKLQNKASSKFGRRVLNASASSYNGTTFDEMHFRFAEAQFLRMSNDKKKKITEVEYTWNQEIEARYEAKKRQFEAEKKPVNEMLVFHGTSKESIDKIVREGFKVGGEGVAIRWGAAYGHGVYTAANPEISIPYSAGSGMMLLSVALCGKLKEDYTEGGSQDVFVVKKGDQLLPKYIVHFA